MATNIAVDPLVMTLSAFCFVTMMVSIVDLWQLLDVSIVKDQKTGQSQGFAFLTVSFVNASFRFLCIYVVP